MSMILFADDEEHLRLTAAQSFDLHDLPVTLFSNAKDLLDKIDKHSDVVVVTDIRMPGMDGIELLNAVKDIDNELPVILVTGHADVTIAVNCMQNGAYDFIEKPYAQNHLIETVTRAIEKRRLTLEVRSLRNNLNHQQILKTNMNGKSAVIQAVRDQISALANVQTDILISGETGTGKGTAARLLHELSARQHGPFVHINCATIPNDLVEIELFGHEAGAFPSATHSRYGKFEHARGGTIFLDSIEALSQEIQGKLLQAINDRIITKLGSNSPIELDVRFIASSQKDLKILTDKGQFRSDLYYCLAGAKIQMPSLRDRKEDIAQLFNEFAKLSSLRHKVQTPFIPSSLYMQLSSSDWPGNLHELQRIVDRFVLNIDLDLSSTDLDFKDGMSLNDLLANQERAIIASALTANEGSLKNTYESLKISRKALYEKMLKFNLRREDFSTDE